MIVGECVTRMGSGFGKERTVLLLGPERTSGGCIKGDGDGCHAHALIINHFILDDAATNKPFFQKLKHRRHFSAVNGAKWICVSLHCGFDGFLSRVIGCGMV